MKSIMKFDRANRPQAVNSLFDNFLNGNLSRFLEDDFWGVGENAVSRAVPVNIRETDKTYELDLIAPGLKKEDFRIRTEDKMLTVSFEHKEEHQEEGKDGKLLRSEYKMESFSRSFHLGDTVDNGNISARYGDGILHLTLPKKEEAQRLSREISVE